jgi:hypothetical protein
MGLGLHYWNFLTPEDPQRIAETHPVAVKTTERRLAQGTSTTLPTFSRAARMRCAVGASANGTAA